MRIFSYNNRHPAAALVLVISVVACLAMWIARQVRTGIVWEVSPLAERVLRSGGRRRVHAETAFFVYHAPDTKRLIAMQDATEFAYARVREYFPGASDTVRGHVFSVGEDLWNRMLRAADRRRDSLAMQMGNEIFVLDTGTPADLSVRISHETVHYRLWQLWGDELPVWLDEGLAGCLGWDIAEAYRLKKGWMLSREFPGGKRGRPVDIEAITKWSEYPAPGPDAEAFYNQSEALIRAIARNIGYGKLHGFVAGIMESSLAWDVCLRERFGFSDYDFEWLAEEVERGVNESRRTE